MLRTSRDGDVAFLVNNESDQAVTTSATLPVDGVPEIWDPRDGSTEVAATYDEGGSKETTVPLRLDPYETLAIVFQKGTLESLLGFTSNGGVTNWLPLFLFVILFGLSMDYHVFLLSRIREAVDRGMSTADAVAHGIKSTAGVITSAAAVMVITFAMFATGSDQSMKQLGVGVVAAILFDASIVRAVLLPATMKLLGDRNWYLPKWLEWLPHLDHGEIVETPRAHLAAPAFEPTA